MCLEADGEFLMEKLLMECFCWEFQLETFLLEY